MNGFVRIFARALATTAAITLLAVATPASADIGDEEIPAGTRVAARTHPAVQLTSLTFTAQVVVPTPQVNTASYNQLVQLATTAATNGTIPSDERSMAKYLFQQMAADIDRYLTAGAPNRTVDAEVGGMCTGWWITPDGYMVTGAHCVDKTNRELTGAFSKQALQKFSKEDAQTILTSLQRLAPDEELLKLAQQMYITFNNKHLKIQNLKKSLSVVQSLPGGGVDKTARNLAADVVSVGENYPGKDFALLKVKGQRNLPTLTLGDDADVQIGNTLYISGFPGLVTNTPFFSLESKLEPTLTEGPYNAKRTTKQGVPYIQTQAPSYHGNSGGPVFGRNGNVIGMLIAGTVTEGGEAAENESFVLPVSIIKEKLNEKGVTPSMSKTTTRYNEALDDFFQKHYKDALPKFVEVQSLYPNHPYVARYIIDSQQAISAGKDETPQPIWLWVMIGAGTLIAFLGALALLVVIRRRRRGPKAISPASDKTVRHGVVHLAVDDRRAGAYPPAWQQNLPPRQSLPPSPPARQSLPSSPPPKPTPLPRPGMPPSPQNAPAPPQHAQPLDSPTVYVRRAPSPYANPSPEVADLERELAELRRQLQERPPGG